MEAFSLQATLHHKEKAATNQSQSTRWETHAETEMVHSAPSH